ASLKEEDYYTAGVVEFLTSSLSENVAAYVDIINSENASSTDIIVFPESTLNDHSSTTFVPDPKELVNPCLSDPNATYFEEFLVTISCAARNASKYVVINLTEKQKCEDVPEDTRPCASNGLNVYNTNVVFDRQGVVVSRYRKIHLWIEQKNTTYLPELITFETDFGVTFGHFICYDILFYSPAHQLIREQGIKDFVYPTMWFSQLPFHTGEKYGLITVQIQQGWAYSNDVNLLAAGASLPTPDGSTGSGIYHGRHGTLVSVMRQDSGERTIYVAQVPKYSSSSRGIQKRVRRSTPRQVATNSRITLTRDQLEDYETEVIEFGDGTAPGNLTRTLCQGSFCCRFNISWRFLERTDDNASFYSYRIGAFDGFPKRDEVEVNYIRNCGLFSCFGPGIEDCGQLIANSGESQIAFTHLEIGVTFPESREFLLFPQSLLDDLLPLEPSQFEWSQEKASEESYQQEVRFALKDSQEVSNVLSFAVYGNYYDNECTYGVGSEEEQESCGYKSSAS
ncbi:hypothetical protein KR067_004939, partial [Drosophila pandora]